MTERLTEAARLYAARDLPATEAVCRAILADHPDHFDTLHLLGVVLTLSDRPAEAVPHLVRARAMRPDHPLLVANLGNALLALHRYEEAVAASDLRAPEVCNNRGLALLGLQRVADAEAAFREAIRLDPDYAPAWANLGNALTGLDRLEEALIAFRNARRCAPPETALSRIAGLVNDAGRTLLGLGRPEEALAECRQFLAVHPDEPTVRWNTSLVLLLMGDFEEGWRLYEDRFGIADHDERPEGSGVLKLEAVAGKRVLIMTEQGRGDMVQFVRYAPLLAARGAEVWVQAYPDLVPLLAAMPGVAGVIGVDQAIPRVDFRTPVMSLPLAFGVHPANVPYLRVPEDRVACLGPASGRRIGVVWSGSAHSFERSAVPAEMLAPLFALPGCEFHCLQPEIVARDQAWLDAAKPPIRRHAPRDFADTAALVQAMDHIVSVDTAVAHLAGALARPLSLLLSFNPDWRWGLGRADCAWYPTARLFRQPSRGDWASAIGAMVTALGGGMAANPGGGPVDPAALTTM